MTNARRYRAMFASPPDHEIESGYPYAMASGTYGAVVGRYLGVPEDVALRLFRDATVLSDRDEEAFLAAYRRERSR